MQPKPPWFVVAPIVTIIAGVVPLFSVEELDLGVFFALGYLTIRWFLYFSLGLWAVFIWDEQLLLAYAAIFLYVGWSFYLILVTAGMQKSKKLLFWILIVLLVANSVGCQLAHFRGVFHPGYW